MFLSVVIPAYNESKNIQDGCLEDVARYLKKQKYEYEVLLVDDGSTDSTFKLLQAYAKKNKYTKALKEPHRGKAGTVIAGMLASSGDIVLFTDLDQATPIEQVEKLLPKLQEGYDIAIGSRQGREGAPVVRKIMAFGFAALRTVILRLPYKDTQCGFKAFKRESSKEIFKRLKVFKEGEAVKGSAVTAGFDLEILYVARKLKYKVAEVPVIWHHKGTVRVSPIKDSYQGFRDLLKVRLNAFQGKYRV